QRLREGMRVARRHLAVAQAEALGRAHAAVERLVRREGMRRLEVLALPVGPVAAQVLAREPGLDLRESILRVQDDGRAQQQGGGDASHFFSSRRTRARSSSGLKGFTM